jgi:biopolymer transport protein ExbD
LATWDVFRSDRLEMERALSTEAVRLALERGTLHDDDLIRPAGTTIPWARLADFPALVEPPPAPTFEFEEDLEEGEGTDEPPIASDAGLGEFDLDLDEGDPDHEVELPSVEALPWVEDAGEIDPLEEDEDAVEFTLARGDPAKVEELDLAAMVDVAFQLVLFFLVTAWNVVIFKSLEVPKPNPDTNAAAAVQGKANTLTDLKNDYILVEIGPEGAMKIDREPVPAAMSALVERLRSARETTGRKAMLLSADSATPHRNAVLAYDAANEIGLGIAIARPAAGKGNPGH